MFFDELKECKLERQDCLYSLGRDDFDHLFGINDVMTLTPDDKCVKALADITFLFGVLGINIESFTAVASGYLASYSGDGYEATFIVNGYEDYVKEEILKICNEIIEEDSSYTPLYVFITNLINNGYSLSYIALATSSFINGFSLRKVKDQTVKAMEQFNNVNQQNCHDNHFILCKIFFSNEEYAKDLNELKDISDLGEVASKIHMIAKEKYSFTEEEEEEYKNKMYEALRLYDIVLNDFILPGYLTYRGRDRDNNKIEQDSKIINDQHRIDSLITLLKSKQDIFNYDIIPSIIQILNMCSTDYTADMAYDYMSGISSFKNSVIDDDVLESMKKYIPTTENNSEEKKETRKLYNFT